MGSFRKEYLIPPFFLFTAVVVIICGAVALLKSSVALFYEPIGTKSPWFATPEAFLGFCLLAILFVFVAAGYLVYIEYKIYKNFSVEEKKELNDLLGKSSAFVISRLKQRQDKLGKIANAVNEFSEEVLR